MLLQKSRLAVFARRRARVEIIPLIDVVFFLLATFVLFTLSLNRIQSLRVDLPVPGKPDERPETVTLQVSAGTLIYWNDESIDQGALPARLAHYKGQVEAPRVVIAGDERAKFGSLVGVLDAVRQAGITAYSVETKPRSGPR